VTDRKKDSEASRSRRKPATTPEGREAQLVSLAVDLAEKQLAEGTASAQVISHYLKLGSSREVLEQQRIRHENELLAEKTRAMASTKHGDELYLKALTAMRAYSGQPPVEHSDEYDD
jgi:hypothetical protein